MSQYVYEYEELKIELTVGGKKFERVVPNFEVISRRGAPVKLLTFEVGNIKSPAQGGLYTGTVNEGDDVQLIWGLAATPTTVFKGKVTSLYNSRTVMAVAKDDGRLLMSTITVTNTRNETTSQIVKRLASEAGLNPGKVSTKFDVVHPHFVAPGVSIQQALLMLKYTLTQSFGQDTSELCWWVDGAGAFHFGAWDDQTNGRNTCEKPLEITNKTNLIELEAPVVAGRPGRVLTHAWPYFDHSQEVSITDDRLAQISGETYRIDIARHIQSGHKARTDLTLRSVE